MSNIQYQRPEATLQINYDHANPTYSAVPAVPVVLVAPVAML